MTLQIVYDAMNQSAAADPVISLGSTGKRDTGIMLNKLLAGRMFIQGASGSGKSYLLRRLLEQTAGLVQHIIIDVEGELAQLSGYLGYPVAYGHKQDPDDTGEHLARRIRETRQSMCFDPSQVKPAERLRLAANFLNSLIEVQRNLWDHPALVVVDEAQVLAPQVATGLNVKEQRLCTAAMVDLMSRGRKRGLAGVIASQRIARVSKSVVSEALNYMIGGTQNDVDIKRAGDLLGMRHIGKLLTELPRGAFVTMGPAFYPDDKLIIEVGLLRYPNIGGNPDANPAPPRRSPSEAAMLLGLRA